MKMLFAATALAALTITNYDNSAAATVVASKKPTTVSSLPVRQCVRDPHALGALFGSLPRGDGAMKIPSFVQIVDESPAIDMYAKNLGIVLSGRQVEPSESDFNDPNYLSTFAANERIAIQSLGAANIAYVRPDGRFICHGFSPGNYVLIATTRSLGSSSLAPSLAGRVPITTYFFGHATVPGSRRPIAIGVDFSELGRSPQ